MAQIKITDSAGKSAGTIEVSDGIFAIEPNGACIHQVVRSQMAARRQGTHDTKTRGQVSGGGRKPFRQKGTGRARQGTTRAAQFRHGGVVFGPHPRSYAFRVNNKVVKLAMASVLSGKLAADELFVVDGFNFDKPRPRLLPRPSRPSVARVASPSSSTMRMSTRSFPSVTSRRFASSALPSPTPTTCSTTGLWL